MEGYRWLPNALDLPWLNYLLVNAPDDYQGGFSWYDIYDNPDPGVKRSRALLEDLLDGQREFGYPAEQTFLFGFSQGCLMTMEIAMRGMSTDSLAVLGLAGMFISRKML